LTNKNPYSDLVEGPPCGEEEGGRENGRRPGLGPGKSLLLTLATKLLINEENCTFSLLVNLFLSPQLIRCRRRRFLALYITSSGT
jgi:hypothetical protein